MGSGSKTYRLGDTVAAATHLGKRAWCSGVPAGTVGVVVDIDWLTDLRVEFDLDGDWLSGRCTVEKVVAASDVRLIRRTAEQYTATR